jgi:hypothetical protein
MNYRLSGPMPPFAFRLVGGVVASVLLANCASVPRYATEADAVETGVVLRARHVNVAGGELTVRNAGTRPCFVTNPYHCSVYLTLHNAQHEPLAPNRKVKRRCDPDEAHPVRLGPGDSIRYALESPRADHDEAELRKARFFEVVYQGVISPKEWPPRRPRHLSLYTLKTNGALN